MVKIAGLNGKMQLIIFSWLLLLSPEIYLAKRPPKQGVRNLIYILVFTEVYIRLDLPPK